MKLLQICNIKKKDKKNDIYFNDNTKITYEGKLKFSKNDCVFVENTNQKILDSTLYKILRDHINDNGNVTINKLLDINKFSSIFLKDKVYENSGKDTEIIKNLKLSFEEIKLEMSNYTFIEFSAVPVGDIIIGLGNQNVLETDITLHNTYGIPYIPGSAIKGILRDYILKKYYFSDEKETSDDIEKKAFHNKEFIDIFGGNYIEDNKPETSMKGNVIFMDCFPDNAFSLKYDVMTPHHKDYYSPEKENFPLDTDEPSPIKFLVLSKKDLKINFNLAIENSYLNIKDYLIENLIEALNFHGIGAKTSLGYGFFDINYNEIKNQIEENISKIVKKRKENEILNKIKENEILKKRKENEILNKTKNMTPLNREIYNIENNSNNQKNDLMKLFAKYLKDYENSILNSEEKKMLASYMKEYFISNNLWKIKKSKKFKKNNNRIEIICKILNETIPK